MTYKNRQNSGNLQDLYEIDFDEKHRNKNNKRSCLHQTRSNIIREEALWILILKVTNGAITWTV